jgi:4-alpha-glucanotransferase
MRFERAAGILLHPTSLPGRFGIGDLGPEAYHFVNFLESAGQTLWQVFPLGPTGFGDSPYQCFSAFAGNPNLISPEKLHDKGLLTAAELIPPSVPDPHRIDFGSVINYKKELLTRAYENFKRNSSFSDKNFNKFCELNSVWLEDYSFFMAVKEHFGGGLWTAWDRGLVKREEKALNEWKTKLSDGINYHKFVQYVFFEQWSDIKNYANSKGIKIIGDMPIFIAYDSADLWAHKELFSVDGHGNLTFVAGVPPDYFSATGQLWGNPLYRWDEMEKDDFRWWQLRMKQIFDLVDMVRIDHFRGFDAYWEIPGGSATAEKGRWVKAPGEKFFRALEENLGRLPIIAEDLGVITKSVESLRDKFDFPGMKILQFAFGTGMERKFLPHNYKPNCLVYTGSHDNDTTRAYFEKEKDNGNDIYQHARQYLDYSGDDLTGELIRTAYASVADLVIIPMQDILRLGGVARMNFPGKSDGNWQWRFTWDQVSESAASHLKYMCRLYERPPEPVTVTEIDVN